MRVKSDSKRSELVRAATAVFMELGYERTQMEQISARAQCSKGTLYSYFSSKEELFIEAVAVGTLVEAKGVISALEISSEPMHLMLKNFGLAFLTTLYTPQFQSLRKLAFSSSSELVGRRIYTEVVEPYQFQVAALMKHGMDNNQLLKAEPLNAALHLCALLESELLLKFMLNALEEITPTILEGAASRAVDTFMRAFSKQHITD